MIAAPPHSRVSAPATRFRTRATRARSLERATVTRSSSRTITTHSSTRDVIGDLWADASITRSSGEGYDARSSANSGAGGFWADASIPRSSATPAIPRFSAHATAARGSVTANVMASCVVRVGDLDFGDYVASADLADDVESQIRVTCSAGQSFNIALDAGQAIGATVAARSLTSRSGALPYVLYTTPGRRAVWGDGSHSTSTMDVIGSGFPQTYSVFGRIAPGQYVTPGRYSDTFDVTLSY